MRIQTNGSALPNPRLVDVNIFLNREKYSADENNVLLLPFGQLLAHDISGLLNDIIVDENGDFKFYNYFDVFIFIVILNHFISNAQFRKCN